MRSDKIVEVLLRSFYGVLLGIIYVVLASEEKSSFIPAAMTGFLIGALTGVLEKWVFPIWLRRRRFSTVLSVRILSYFLVIVLSLWGIVGLFSHFQEGFQLKNMFDWEVLRKWMRSSIFWEIVLFSFLLLSFTQFVVLVSRLLGRNRLLNYIVGRYYHPKEEERIFMFMDIKSSTSIAERLGHFQWHRLLNDFFFDIAEPIRRSKGEIYQYVGDEVVVTWPKELGVKNMNCIRCFFWIEHKMKARRDKYLRRYGYVPMFKAGFHLGKVVAGEIGDYKREMVFHGDTINTASRIQQETNNIGRRLLLSNQILRELNLEDKYKEEYIGIIKLRGKEQEVTLFSLDEIG